MQSVELDARAKKYLKDMRLVQQDILKYQNNIPVTL